MAQWSKCNQPTVSERLPLYMPSYPSAPLVLQPGNYNRDRRSSHPQLLQVSCADLAHCQQRSGDGVHTP